MVSLNATGIIGRDAVCFAMQDKYVVNFSIASNKTYKDAQGTIVAVQGNPEINVFSKQDGSQGYSLKCIVNEIDFYSQNKTQ